MKTVQRALEQVISESATWWAPKNILVGAVFVAGIASIVLTRYGILPLSLDYLAFYSLLLFALALYRPRFVLYALVAFLPFEMIFIGPKEISVDIRLFQWAGFLLGLATLILLLQKKQGVSFPKIRWFDGLLFLIVVGAFLAAHSGATLKQACIVLSFGLLYGLGRVWIQRGIDLVRLLPFFWVTAIVVCGYGVVQAWQLQHGQEAFTTMVARPNSVFPEADWLGLFSAVALGIAWLFLSRSTTLRLTHRTVAFVAGWFSAVALILSVSRSAWLAFFCFAFIFLWGCVYLYRSNLKAALLLGITIALQIGLAFVVVVGFGLTSFKLDERLGSTASGEQVVTIACETPQTIVRIESFEELATYNCQHINLEDIESFQATGFSVQEVTRPDPNISLRRHIYEESLILIHTHWFRGIGWGEVQQTLGTDGNGAGLNTSNMFLEVWLGSGFLGIVGFWLYWFLLGGIAVKEFCWREKPLASDPRGMAAWILLAFWVLFSVFNMFNAGLLLGAFCGFLVGASWYLSKVAPHFSNLWHK